MKKMLMAMCSVLLLMACDRSTDKTKETAGNDSSKQAKKIQIDAQANCTRGTFDSLAVLKKSSGNNSDSIYMSLNGVERGTALEMIGEYRRNPSRTPFQFSFFFRKQMVEEMRTMLCNEKADGVRIYFAATKGGGNGSKTTVILMPTKYCGSKTNIPEADYHGDYFDHQKDTKYFAELDEATRGGDKETIRSGGLYTLFQGTESPCPGNNSNSITRREASEMVGRWDNPRQMNNTRAAWYPLSVFEEVLKTPRCTGMRIYFGRHKVDETQRHLSGRNTFIIVATQFDKETQTNVNFYECNSIIKESSIRLKERFLNEPQDMGELCPDNCTICDPNDPTTDCATGGLNRSRQTKPANKPAEIQTKKQ